MVFFTSGLEFSIFSLKIYASEPCVYWVHFNLGKISLPILILYDIFYEIREKSNVKPCQWVLPKHNAANIQAKFITDKTIFVGGSIYVGATCLMSYDISRE